MYAVEFKSTISDGKIVVPEEYMQNSATDVKIIILFENFETTNLTSKPTLKKSIKGIINKYAKPELMRYEKEAWEKAVVKK